MTERTAPQPIIDPRDPAVPDDGSCVQCHGPRKPSGQSLQPHKATAAVDPFCSSECARAWYGVSLPSARYSTAVGYRPTPSPEHMRRARYNGRSGA